MTTTRKIASKHARLLGSLAAVAVLLSLSYGVYAGEKDKSKAGTERKSTNNEEPDVVQISVEKFACNTDVISIGSLKAAGWYKLNNKQRFELARDSDSPLLAIRGKTIQWWCGAAGEDWEADTGAQYIIVSRGPKGAGTVTYYKKK